MKFQTKKSIRLLISLSTLLQQICFSTEMKLHLFAEHACGDGSPSGIYKSASSNAADLDHVIAFQGGGACSSDEDCLVDSLSSPNRFSSKKYPETILGRTILSGDATENIDGLEHAAKWFVPYCSQDGYLGVGLDGAGGLKRNGSLQFLQALRYWASSSEKPRRLVVAGMSIGAMGILNHMEELVQVANEAGVTELVIMLDSGVLSAHQLDLGSDMATYLRSATSEETHPLCFEDDINFGRTSSDNSLPCCLSLTCMLSHTVESRILNPENSRILLTNSMYDNFELSYILRPQKEITFSSEIGDEVALNAKTNRLAAGIDNIWNVGESGGERKHLLQQSINANTYKNQLESKSLDIMWLSTSCVGHTLLEPAPELERLVKCNEANSKCNETAIGSEFDVYDGLKMTIWKPTLSWSIANINGVKLHSLIADFLHESPGFGSVVLQDTCHGPNCVDIKHQSGPNECMALIEIQDMNVPIPVWIQFLVLSSLLAMFVFGFVFRFPRIAKMTLSKQRTNTIVESKLISSQISEQDFDDSGRTLPLDLEMSRHSEDVDNNIVVAPISVYIKPSSPGLMKKFIKPLSRKKYDQACAVKNLKDMDLPLLQGVTFSFPRGKLTALAGESGAGKSTLVSAILHQVNPKLDFYTTQNILADYTVVFLRQDAHCNGMNRITAETFLTRNALLYSSSADRLDQVLTFIEPFKATAVENLSGGQLRRLELCSAILTRPDILILDEPLSGLDSVSTVYVLELLKDVADQDNTAILMTVHQPSSELLVNYFSKLISIEDGKIICNANTSELWGGDNSCFCHNAQEEVHELLGRSKKSRLRGYVEDKLTNEWGKTGSQASRQQKTSKKILNTTPTLYQSVAIQQRIHSEKGISKSDFVRLPLIMMLVAAVFQFDADSPTQLIFVVACFISVPVNVLRYLIHQHCQFYEMHRSEVVDRRISCLAFIFGSQPYQFSLPVAILLLSLTLCYLILGWSFNTLIVQFLFSAFYFLLNMQLGRAVGSYYEGDYERFAKMYSLMITLATLFGGAVVKVSSLPLWTPWIISHNYWANAGATLDQLQRGPGLGHDTCTSLLSCILSDPNVVAHYRGYTPYATTFGSFFILFGLYAVTIVAEIVITLRKVNRFARPKSTAPPKPLCISETIIRREVERRSSQERIDITRKISVDSINDCISKSVIESKVGRRTRFDGSNIHPGVRLIGRGSVDSMNEVSAFPFSAKSSLDMSPAA